MDHTNAVVAELSETESWEFLRSQEIGRLAYRLADEVHIAPVNFAVTGRRLVFRTAEGSKLLGVTMHKSVALEVDDFDQQRARSVVVRGTARHLHGAEADAAAQVPLHPWVPTEKYEHVAIDVEEITGRRFVLERG
ncbi:MAG TPA: pyridoxamine 5'-phosphate oxidase family protein [Actinotalea sp.]|nr:pyridoxamine 5'-phosphate oxidase family protein [Actinotalea sp.]